MKLPPHLPKNLRTRANMILEETESSKMARAVIGVLSHAGFSTSPDSNDVGWENVALEIQLRSKDRELLQARCTLIMFSIFHRIDIHI